MSGDCYIGSSGHGSLTITTGGQVNSGSGYVGGYNGVADVKINGAGSGWTLAGPLFVDSPSYSVSGNTAIVIAGGGALTSAGGHIGSESFGAGVTSIIVDGVGSYWNNTGSFSIGDGYRSGTSELDILHGGQVTNARAQILSSTNDTPTKVTVDGVGSIWMNTSSLTIGNSPGNVELDIYQWRSCDSWHSCVFYRRNRQHSFCHGAGGRRRLVFDRRQHTSSGRQRRRYTHGY